MAFVNLNGNKRIELFCGDGFTGRTYQMVIIEYINIGHGPGGKEDEALALAVASKILQERGMNVDLRNCQFTHDGSL